MLPTMPAANTTKGEKFSAAAAGSWPIGAGAVEGQLIDKDIMMVMNQMNVMAQNAEAEMAMTESKTQETSEHSVETDCDSGRGRAMSSFQ